MYLIDLSYILRWWFIYLVIGVIFLPFTIFIFKNFFDRGYIFSKILGSAVITYLIFITSELHLFTFESQNIYFISIILIFISVVFAKKTNFNIRDLPIRFLIFEEFLFLITLFFWSSIRNFQPDIHGLEKFMDFGFINSILRTKYLPPIDIWYPPFSINYYYFGHLTTAVLTKMVSIDSKITFNLMVATIFAFCFTAIFSISANLIYLFNFLQEKKLLLSRKLKFIMLFTGILSALLISFGGNLHTIYAFFKAYDVNNPIPFWQLKFLPLTFPNQYWYPNATRFIYHTIHEFPIYSFVVSDLHGHVLDIPNVLLAIAILLAIFIRFKNYDNNKIKIASKSWRMDTGILLLVGFLLAILYMTNAWDSLIYLSVFALFIFCFSKEILIKKIILILLTFLSFLLFSLPFSIFFQPLAIANQVGLVCSPNFLIHIGHIGPLVFEPNQCDHSYWWELLILYGFFIFNFLSFIFFITKKKQNPIDEFIVFLSMMGFLLIIIPEFFYLKDIYTTYYRANTMFKLVYQAFIILSLSSGYMIIRIITSFKDYSNIKKIFSLIFILFEIALLTLVFLYSFFAINGYYGNLETPKGLNGQKYLDILYPDDYKAINWINQNIKGQPIMLEAQGDSYTDYERISTNTGLPTILGWTVHEWLWRGSYDILVPRINDIKTIYETSNINLTKELLQQYNVKYVYIGNLEKQKYPNLNEEKFNEIGTLIYQSSTVKIFELN